MPSSIDDVFKFEMATDIGAHGLQIITSNFLKRIKSQCVHVIFCVFLFFVYLFTNPNSEILGQSTPFLMTFLFFMGSVGTLLFFRTLLVSDIRGHCYIKKAIEEGNKLEYADINKEFFNLAKSKNLKLENLLYIGLTTFISGLFAMSTVWGEGGRAILGVAICFAGLNIVTAVVFLNDLKRMSN